MSIDAYPLAWPTGWPRVPAHQRARARFSTSSRTESGWRRQSELSVHEATRRLQGELERLGALPESIVISTNVELRVDGLPRSGRRAPEDPAVAVYWEIPGGGPGCMAIDLYDRVADNIAAVAATIDALRAISRHGGAQVLRRAFQGFKALPQTTSATLTVDAAWAVIDRYAGVTLARTKERALAGVRFARNKTHPDRGGNMDDFTLIQRAAKTLDAHYGTPI